MIIRTIPSINCNYNYYIKFTFLFQTLKEMHSIHLVIISTTINVGYIFLTSINDTLKLELLNDSAADTAFYIAKITNF